MPSSASIFKKYLNPYFVETGSYRGDGIQAALEAGFTRVYSIELSPTYYELCQQRFAGDPRVHLVFGDSSEVLEKMIAGIHEPITFWLDGHYSCEDTALGKYWTPLMQELDVIKKHPIKYHTIIIDDMRCWKLPNPTHGFYELDIFYRLKEINLDYAFFWENDRDILAARLYNAQNER